MYIVLVVFLVICKLSDNVLPSCSMKLEIETWDFLYPASARGLCDMENVIPLERRLWYLIAVQDLA